MRRLLPPRLFLLCLATMAALHFALPLAILVPSPSNLVGALPLVGGLAIAIWGARRFRTAGTNIKTFDDPDRLVTDGLFRYTRIPMYLGLLTALSGASTLFGSLSPMLVVVAFAVITDRWYIPFEE